MSNAKITELTAATTVTDDDLMVIVDSPASSPTTKSVTFANARAAALDLLLTTRGDIAVKGASTTARLAVGAANAHLESDGTDPVWKGSIHARVYNSATQSIANTTATVLTFDTELWDTDNIHSTSGNTGRLTCVTAGKYLIGGHVEFASNATGFRAVSIRLNGATPIIGALANNAINGDTTLCSLSTIYDLAVNDYVQLYAYQNSGGALNVSASTGYGCEFFMSRIA